MTELENPCLTNTIIIVSGKCHAKPSKKEFDEEEDIYTLSWNTLHNKKIVSLQYEISF